MRKLPLLVELGYLLGLLGLIRCATFFLVVRRAIGQEEKQPSYYDLLKQAEPTAGVLTREGMEMMKRYMQGYPTWGGENGTSFQFRTPGYNLTRSPYWGELTSETECSPPLFSDQSEPDPDIWKLHNGIHGHIMGRSLWWSESDLNELKWEQGAQVQREATAIVNELWNP